jgi:predicted DNA-binding transcriptional regulator AlpA
MKDLKPHFGQENYESGNALELLSKTEAAKFLGVSERTLDRWHAHRKGPARVSAGRRVLYRFSGLTAWLDSNEVLPLGTFIGGHYGNA